MISRLAKNFNDDEIVNGKYYWNTTEEDQTECKLYYNLMLVATENPVSNKNIKLYLSSFDDKGVINNFKFFDIFNKF